MSGVTLQINSERAATACGLVAILLWSTAAGLIRSVSERFGPLGGAALISTLGPVLASAFAALWLGAHLTAQFWQGAVLVTAGSLMCWQANRQRRQGG